MDPAGPNYGVGGALQSFKTYDKSHESGGALTSENNLLLETIPHMMEMIFILTDLDLNYEKIFETNKVLISLR